MDLNTFGANAWSKVADLFALLVALFQGAFEPRVTSVRKDERHTLLDKAHFRTLPSHIHSRCLCPEPDYSKILNAALLRRM